jgi:hypothetical protein
MNKKTIHQLIKTPIQNPAESVAFIAQLHLLGYGFHLDDCVFDVFNSDRSHKCYLSKRACKLLSDRVDELFNLLDKDDLCPHAISLACLEL